VANVTFAGSQTAQVAAGETVTVTVTKPDATKDTLTATTDGSGNYSVTKTYTVAGSYSAIAAGAADAQYTAWTSNPFPFTISLTNRTGTLIVTLA
jgi:TusA-related sulfurtransferase